MHDERILMSESLQGILPELEETTRQIEDALAVISIQFTTSSPVDMFTGVLVGLSIDEKIIKVDLQVSASEGFKKFSAFAKNECTNCIAIHIMLGDHELMIGGPFLIITPKISDFDRQTRTCVLGIDLIRT